MTTVFYETTNLKDDEIFLSLVGAFEADIKRKWVPYYQFKICLLDGTYIGDCNLKIDNSILTKYCGNIGYSILEQYRGNHYSLKASKLLLQLAIKHKLKYVLINCEPTNKASNRICQLLNAEFIKTVNIPKTHEMYEQGTREINIYKVLL